LVSLCLDSSGLFGLEKLGFRIGKCDGEFVEDQEPAALGHNGDQGSHDQSLTLPFSCYWVVLRYEQSLIKQVSLLLYRAIRGRSRENSYVRLDGHAT
jgi:hypothetical protein